MSTAYNSWNPAMIKMLLTSGGTSGATFAASGVAADDVILCSLVLDGATKGVKSVLAAGTGITITAAGAMQTPLIDTNADTVLAFYVDVSAGAET